MNKLIFILTLILLPLISFSQRVGKSFLVGKVTATQTGSGAGYWQVAGIFTDESGRYESPDINVSDNLVFTDNGKLFVLPITLVVSASHPSYTIRVGNTGITDIVAVPTTTSAAIVRGTANHTLLSYSAGIVDADQQLILQDVLYSIDSLLNASDASFDSNRNILRVPTVGANIGGSTISDFLNYFYFTPPTITCNLSPTTTVYEVGTSTSIIISGATTNAGAATLSAGHLTQTAPSADTLKSFTSATSYADTITFTPQQGGSGQFNTLAYSFRATQAWVKGAESGTATSTTRSISGVYPVLYGMSATDFTATGNPYTGLTKLVEAEGDKTVTLTGSGYIYFLVPKTWSDWNLSSIIDHNGFNVTASFTATDINISSSGLTNNWTTQAYRMYKLNTTTTTSGNAYQFNR